MGGRGVGRLLLDRCLAKLGEIGIQRCQLWVYGDNAAAQRFYQSGGWVKRVELEMYSKDIDGDRR